MLSGQPLLLLLLLVLVMAAAPAHVRFDYELRDVRSVVFPHRAMSKFVRLPSDALIGDLHDAILKKNPNILRGLDATLLDVYPPGSAASVWTNPLAAVAAVKSFTSVVAAAAGTKQNLVIIARRLPQPPGAQARGRHPPHSLPAMII